MSIFLCLSRSMCLNPNSMCRSKGVYFNLTSIKLKSTVLQLFVQSCIVVSIISSVQSHVSSSQINMCSMSVQRPSRNCSNSHVRFILVRPKGLTVFAIQSLAHNPIQLKVFGLKASQFAQSAHRYIDLKVSRVASLHNV